MQHRVVVVAAFVLIAMFGMVPDGGAVHEDGYCARDLETVKVGTGTIGIDEPLLNGINHVDVPFPPCSQGQFWLDHDSGNVLFQVHCSAKLVRVYAPMGATAQTATLNWQDGSGTCV